MSSAAAATTGESQTTGNAVSDTAASVATPVPLGPATTTATTSTTATASSSSTEQHHYDADAHRGEEHAAAATEGEGAAAAATATATAGAAARGAKEGGERQQQQQPPAKPEEEGTAEEQHENAETEAAPGGEEGAQENDVTPLPLTEGEAQHVEGEENIEVLPLDIPQEGAPEEQGTGEYPGDNQELADQMFQNESEVNQEEVEPAESSDQSRKRKSGRSRGHKRSPKKSRTDSMGDVGEGDSPRKETLADRVFKAIKPTRRRKSSVSADTEQIAIDFLHEMRSAAANDETATRNKTPAFNKLALLEQVKTQLAKTELKEHFLKCGVLDLIDRWLAPLPDGSLPNLTLRKDLLAILAQLPIKQDHLVNCQLGKTIMKMARHPHETEQNKKAAQRLVDAWLRPILGLSTNYADLRVYNAEMAQNTAAAPQTTSTTSTPSRSYDIFDEIDRGKRETVSSARAFIPTKDAMDFVYCPLSEAQPNKQSVSRKVQSIERSLQSLKKKR